MSAQDRVFVNTEGEHLKVSEDGIAGGTHALAALGWREEAVSQPRAEQPPATASGAQGAPVEVAETDPFELTGGPLTKPKGSASRGEWATYAAAQGIDTDGLTREQLREAVAAH